MRISPAYIAAIWRCIKLLLKKCVENNWEVVRGAYGWRNCCSVLKRWGTLVTHKKTREWSMPSIAEIGMRRTLVRRAERQAWGWPSIWRMLDMGGLICLRRQTMPLWKATSSTGWVRRWSTGRNAGVVERRRRRFGSGTRSPLWTETRDVT